MSLIKITLSSMMLLCVLNFSFSQKYDYNWMLGNKINKGILLNFDAFPTSSNLTGLGEKFRNTNLCLSDYEGNFRFYTTGYQIFNNNHQLMENGDSLNYNDQWQAVAKGHYIPDGIVGLPDYDNPNQITLIHQPAFIDDSSKIRIDKVLFTKIDLGENVGDEVILEKNQLLIQRDSFFNYNVVAAKHANGRDWWILIPPSLNNKYYKFLLSEGEFSEPMIQYIGSIAPEDSLTTGQNRFSLSGNKYAESDVINGTKIFDFDRCTGALSNFIQIPFPDSISFGGGVAFSPNERFLYVDNITKMFQYDLWADDIAGSVELVGEFDGFQDGSWAPTTFYRMQNTPDGKILIASKAPALSIHVINHPNRKGTDCELVLRQISLPDWKSREFPYYPNYRLGPIDNSPCDTLNITNEPMANYIWEIPDSSELLKVDFLDHSFYEPTDWFWEFGDGETSTEIHPQHEFEEAGVYEVCLTVSNQYAEDTQCREVDLLFVETKEIGGLSLKYYISNPVEVNLSIHFDKVLERELEMVVYDLEGRLIQKMELRKGQNNFDCPFDSFPIGTYFYHLKYKKEILSSGKLIKI